MKEGDIYLKERLTRFVWKMTILIKVKIYEVTTSNSLTTSSAHFYLVLDAHKIFLDYIIKNVFEIIMHNFKHEWKIQE